MAWNTWRRQNPSVHPNLSGATLGVAKLFGANFRGTKLSRCDLRQANLYNADLYSADLSYCDLREAKLYNTNLRQARMNHANLWRANLRGANLYRTNLRNANLSESNLNQATLVQTNLAKANLARSKVYGISAWRLNLANTLQHDLIITLPHEPTITVDNLEVAQFIYLLLHNEKIRETIDSITTKAVLILGRFTRKRKMILDSIRNELRNYDYIPILFDFKKSSTRGLLETVSTLAHMSRFIIADITEPRAIPQELERIVPHLPSVPVQPLLERSSTEYGMFESLRDYPWVLKVQRYTDQDDLLSSIAKKIILPAEAMVTVIQEKRKIIERGLTTGD